MLVAMASNTKIIYVRLLDEGTDVMRPVEAVELSDGVFQLTQPGEYDPEFEKWEFAPCSHVRCRSIKLDGETILVAVDRETDVE